MKCSYTFLSVALLIATCSSCATFKAIRYGSPKPDTYRHFECDTITPGRKPYVFAVSQDKALDTVKFNGGRFNHETIADFFSRTRGNGVLLIIYNDSIVFENSFGNANVDSIYNIFSISKAVTSLATGIAVDKGYLKLSDPVTKYIPELLAKDSLFKSLTVEHLLDMRTGLRFKESYAGNPFSQTAKLFYGNNVLNQIEDLKFDCKPGTKHCYNSMATAILGIVLERATKLPFAIFVQDNVWIPLGMERTAFVALDDPVHRHAKTYGGIAMTVKDLAKIGRLYLNKGNWNGKQIISEDFINRSIASTFDNGTYSFGWNNIINQADGKEIISPKFFAIGLFGQVLFCDPIHNLIFVTLGDKKGCEFHWIFDDLGNVITK